MQVPPDVSIHHADAVDQAVAALRYGSININVVTMLGFCVPKLTWGAYPGSTPQACPCLELPLTVCPHVVCLPLTLSSSSALSLLSNSLEQFAALVL